MAKKKARRKTPPKRTPTKKASAGAVYQFRITLLDVHPPVWRRIQVQECFLDELHRHIQGAMGWTDGHMYLFDINDITYGHAFEHDPDGEYVVVSAATTLLRTVLPTSQPDFSFRYTYDLGDSWEHLIVLERVCQPDPKSRYPLCLDGKRACPPENCGGAPGYEHLLYVLRDPEDEEHDELLEWVGGKFDPEDFDPKRATRMMAKGLRS